MEVLDKFHHINSSLLNQKSYFQSLVEQAYKLNLLTTKDISLLQNKLLLILSNQTEKYNNVKSSSISTEKAQDIMTSILYVISIQLKSYKNPDDAIEALKTKSLNSQFENGLKLINRKIMICKYIQKRIMNHMLETSNDFYRLTIIDAINVFFKLYRPEFSAHEIHITADYPVFIGRPESVGIEFIEEYLRCIQAENAFCILFSSKDIHHLLSGLTKDYTKIPFNLFEPVFLSAIGLMVRGKDPIKLDLTQNDILSLYDVFSHKPINEIEKYLRKILSQLSNLIDIPSFSLDYAHSCIDKFATLIFYAIETKNLDKVFLVPTYFKQNSKIILSFENRMNNKQYRMLVERMIQENDSEIRVNLILNKVHDFSDLLDILSDCQLTENEYELVVNRLPLSVFIMLLSQYSNDDFLDTISEKQLYFALQKRKHQLSKKEDEQLEIILNSINVEMI